MRSADLLAYIFAGGRGLKLVALCVVLAGGVFAGVVWDLRWLLIVGLIANAVANLTSVAIFVTAAANSTSARGSGGATGLVSAVFLFLFSAAVLSFGLSRLWL